MKQLEDVFVIKDCTRLKGSIYGNPKYEVVAQKQNGEIVVGKTLTDGAVAYGIKDHINKEPVKLKYHFTQKGNVIFDYLKKI